ncbi:MAG: Long-chain-fatty-acid--CoA ligase, partial [uncultured Nocardioidaceae bacterium]
GHRRPGPFRRRRPLGRRRARRRDDRLRRRERLPPRGGGLLGPPRRGRRGGGRRGGRRGVRQAAAGLRRTHLSRRCGRGRAQGTREDQPGQVQGPARLRFPGRAAAQRHREDHQEGAPRAGCAERLRSRPGRQGRM